MKNANDQNFINFVEGSDKRLYGNTAISLFYQKFIEKLRNYL